MIQRTPTTVVRSETLMDVAFGGLYSEEAVEKGIDVDTADMIFASIPSASCQRFRSRSTQKWRAAMPTCWSG